MKLICYKKCTTCKGVEKMLEEKGISYDYRDIKEDNPKSGELKSWHEKTGLPIKRFFNTSGKIYRENNLKDKVNDMSLDEAYDLLSTDGMLVKRPILFTDEGEIFVGPDVKKYIESL
ncbi:MULTISPECIES: Spx/MgsR family RNA polymerase-binding regulatory protein [Anaerococcus]|uniref:Spx/MgsR family RNA polymerase-binding regulatory protein n=1 Tax=Anaerococcus nagyae TaxID=1755241 RepID=A0A3E2TI70_9FIRM|nr:MULTISPECIES: Spx/MgsR family RNA polymerase-binding regulatory protein [Anaerococcus]MDU1829139.1 Spx/MgsR family RNA polymerase-binding regulatory protein [Anaerococcus sp.]MDU1864128.1 Spx/MgsR family RNA polymerase-binding regulatory protein [Anaerococcus sp.]MDU2565413.1 Spx/MgsR family RNA polymerase-binding regulatory protein [Anaerococcus sp.]RGB76391.1 Spx/MgsR family RNA polymerase-binding regulatory protein [Anaerococcus nagyae]